MAKAQVGIKKPKHKKIIFVDDFLRGKDNQVFDFEFGRIVCWQFLQHFSRFFFFFLILELKREREREKKDRQRPRTKPHQSNRKLISLFACSLNERSTD
jgi:hypothetical protein